MKIYTVNIPFFVRGLGVWMPVGGKVYDSEANSRLQLQYTPAGAAENIWVEVPYPDSFNTPSGTTWAALLASAVVSSLPDGLEDATGEVSDDGVAAFLDWQKYRVGPLDRGCKYQLIQAGIDAAKADGHDEDDPAVVEIIEGSFAEDILLDTPGIHLLGVASQQRQLSIFNGKNIVQNAGKITISYAVPNTFNTFIQGIDFLVDGLCVSVTGDEENKILFRDCQIGTLFDATADVTVVSCTNTAQYTYIDWVDCVIGHSQFGGDTFPMVDTTNYMEFFGTTLQTGGFGDMVALKVSGSGDGRDISFLNESFVFGAIQNEGRTRFVGGSDSIFSAPFFPSAFDGGVVNNSVGTEGNTNSIFEDVTFQNNFNTALFDGSGAGTIGYGIITVFDPFGSGIKRSDWKASGAGSFAVLFRGETNRWSMEHVAYEPATPADWGVDPTRLQEAVDRIAAVVAAAHGAI